ncbi:MAG TPA: NAD(P)/FAD-dependent oxidoreductase [Candidatus Kapabacteria bacterium]|nr:NAD(P)/FAD-dependent oxidoreductase [Candidatus Kapabacteria bacterium]
MDVIVVGGSYAGLAAAMALGRSLRTVLVIDSGLPCNRFTSHSHNVLTHDGSTPAAIAEAARRDLARYESVRMVNTVAVTAEAAEGGFTVTTDDGARHGSRKLLIATGVRDILPPVDGLDACWGISALHCPYCHGYEVHGTRLAVLGNGDMGYEMVRLISNWSPHLSLYTNGAPTLTIEQREQIRAHGIAIVEEPLRRIEHESGRLRAIEIEDGTRYEHDAIFVRPAIEQHSDIASRLGCSITEQGLVAVDQFGATSMPGVFAAGDATTSMRTVAAAIASGTMAGAMMNRELIAEEWSR